jgi:hypothetical protein
MNLFYPIEANVTNALLDFSDNSNTMTNFGMTFSSTEGYDTFGYLAGDGLGSYATIPETITTNQTLCFWLKVPSILVNVPVFRDVTGINGNVFLYSSAGYNWRINGHTLNTGLGDGTFLNWGHNCFVFKNNQTDYYMNATFIQTNPYGITWTGTYMFLDKNGNNAQYDNAYVDDIRLYNYVLSQKEITSLYNNNDNTILNSALSVGDTWGCNVTAFNSTSVSNIYTSNIVNITNTTCTILTNATFTKKNFYCNLLTTYANLNVVVVNSTGLYNSTNTENQTVYYVDSNSYWLI